MRRAIFHGLRLELDDESGEDLFPILCTDSSNAGPCDLEIRLTHGDAGGIDAITRLDPLFFHGKTRAFDGGDHVVLIDGTSWVRVARDGRSIESRVDPRSLEDGYSFAHTTLFIALMIALRAHGLFHLHAAVLVRPSGGREVVMIAGEGGSGKTSTTLALLDRGYHYLGDDAVLVTRRERRIVLLQIAKPFHLDEQALEPFPQYRRFLGPRYLENHGKRSFDARAAFPGRERESAPSPSCLLFPRVASQPKTLVVPLSQAEAMVEITRSGALATVPTMSRTSEQLELFRDLVADARAYSVALGRDMLADPGVIDRAVVAGLG